MSLQQSMATETVDRLNMRTALTVRPDQTVRDAVLEMRKGKLGCVVVIDDRLKPVGIFTEAMLRLAICRDPDCIETVIAEHMAKTFPWVTTDDPIETVLNAMEAKNHRFVVVIDDKHRIVGITGQKGLMEYIAEQFPTEVMVQRVGSSPFPKTREGA